MQKIKALLIAAFLTVSAMAQTISNLELQRNVNLQPGAYASPGTYNIPDDVYEVGIEFTRNNWVSTGTNFIFEAFLEISTDGGQSWPYLIEVNAIGGTQLDKFGNVITRDYSTQGIPAGTNRKARVRYNINQPLRTTIKITLISP